MSNQRDKVMSLEACRYEDLAKYSKVFNSDTCEYHLWVYLNPEDVRGAYFVGAVEIGPNADNSRIFPDTFVRESQCWIRVNKNYIGTTPGKHTVKLAFVDTATDTDFNLYISFYMQVDNPEKPYVYMQDTPKEVEYNYLIPSDRDNGFTLYEG